MWLLSKKKRKEKEKEKEKKRKEKGSSDDMNKPPSHFYK